MELLSTPERAPLRRWLLFLFGGLAVAAALATLAFGLGSWAYQYRRYSLHEGRLQRLLERHPTLEQARAGLLAEPGTQEMEVPRSEGELRAFVGSRGAAKAEAVIEKRRRYATLRLFGVGDMVYALYFDEAGRLRDAVLWSN